MKKVIIIALAAAGLMQTAVYAENKLNAVYNAQTENIVLNGAMGKLEMQELLVRIYGAGEGGINTEDINSAKGFAFMDYTGENGCFEISFKLPKEASGGKYTASVISGGAEEAADFMYINTNEANLALEELNKAAGASYFKSALAENAAQLGVDSSVFADGLEFISQVMYSLKPQGGYGISGFNIIYARTEAAYKVLKLGEDLKTVAADYADRLTVDAEKLSKIDADTEIKLLELLKKADYSSADFDTILKESYILSGVICSQRYTDVKQFLKENALYLGLTQSYSDDVYKYVYNNRSQLKTIEDLQKLIKNAGRDTGGASAGGGGGSPTPSGSVSVNGSAGDIIENTLNRQEKFSDIAGHWAQKAILELNEMGIVSGYPDGTFRPDESVTRAEFLILCMNAFAVEQSKEIDGFADVTPEDWYYGGVMKAAAAGIIYGDGGAFRPNDTITREDAAVILYRLMQADGEDTAENFADRDKISDYARNAVGVMASKGIISGYDGKFAPKDNATRAMAVMMINNTRNMGD